MTNLTFFRSHFLTIFTSNNIRIFHLVKILDILFYRCLFWSIQTLIISLINAIIALIILINWYRKQTLLRIAYQLSIISHNLNNILISTIKTNFMPTFPNDNYFLFIVDTCTNWTFNKYMLLCFLLDIYYVLGDILFLFRIGNFDTFQ